MPGEAVWLFLLCVVLPLGEGTFSVSRQYHSRHAERGPIVIALDDSEGPLDEPTEIFEAAKSRQARQTGDSNPPQPRTTLRQLNTPGELYGIVHWDGLPQTVSLHGQPLEFNLQTTSLVPHPCSHSLRFLSHEAGS